MSQFGGRINTLHYEGNYGKTAEEEIKIKNKARNAVVNNCGDLSFGTIDYYNMGGARHAYEAGNERRLILFANATNKNAVGEIELEKGITLLGEETRFKKFLKPLKEDGDTLIKSEDGMVIAEYFPKTFQLNILFDIFETYDKDFESALDYITLCINEMIPELTEKHKRWNVEENKERLSAAFKKQMKDIKERMMAEDRERLRRCENDVAAYMRNITEMSRKRKMLMLSIAANENNQETDEIEKDFDLIAAHPKVKSLMLDGKYMFVKTVPLYITSDKGKRYYGGKYTVKINMENSDVRFSGNNGKAGYWTDHDPHPHVNASNGVACLGNVSETIAELCSAMQAYALVMICIDFLEAANTSDAAGRKVVNWDEVDENNESLMPTTEPIDFFGVMPTTGRCVDCGNEFDIDDLYDVYAGTEEDENGTLHATGHHLVCEQCRNDDYYLDDEVDEYLQD